MSDHSNFLKNFRISIPDNCIINPQSKESMLMEHVQTCNIIMNIPGPGVKPVTSDPGTDGYGEKLSGTDTVLEWNYLEQSLGGGSIKPLIAGFPWLRRLNSSRFSIEEFNRRFRCFLIRTHPSTIMRHWGCESKKEMNVLNSLIDEILDLEKYRVNSESDLGTLNRWYSKYIRELNYVEFRSFFMKDAPLSDENIETSHPRIPRKERHFIKKTFLDYLGNFSNLLQNGFRSPNSTARDTEWLMAYNSMVIDLIFNEPGLEGILINLIIRMIPAARHIFTMLPFPVWSFLNDPRLLRLITAENPVEIIADMIQDVDIVFPQYREQCIINLNLCHPENTVALDSLLDYMSTHGVPRSCATELVFSSFSSRARHYHIRNRTVSRGAQNRIPASREHVLAESFIKRATEQEFCCYRLAIEIFRKIIRSEEYDSEYVEDDFDENFGMYRNRGGKLNPGRFQIPLNNIPPRTRKNIDPQGHHNMPYTAMIFTSTLMSKIVNVWWAVKQVNGKELSCRETALMTGIVNRTLNVLQRYLNDQTFRPVPDIAASGKESRRKSGDRKDCGASSKTAGARRFAYRPGLK